MLDMAASGFSQDSFELAYKANMTTASSPWNFNSHDPKEAVHE